MFLMHVVVPKARYVYIWAMCIRYLDIYGLVHTQLIGCLFKISFELFYLIE